MAFAVFDFLRYRIWSACRVLPGVMSASGPIKSFVRMAKVDLLRGRRKGRCQQQDHALFCHSRIS